MKFLKASAPWAAPIEPPSSSVGALNQGAPHSDRRIVFWNIIPVTKAQAMAHDGRRVEELYPAELVARIDQLLAQAKPESKS